MMKRSLSVGLLLTIWLCVSWRVYATPQVAERIWIDGVEKKLLTLPLDVDSVLEACVRELVDGTWSHTGCWRAYVGTWQLEDGQLYLLKLENRLGEEVVLPDAFLPYQVGERYHASWFTGELRVGEGENIYTSIQYLGFSYYFARETFYVLEQGMVREERTYTNSYSPATVSFSENVKKIASRFDFGKFSELAAVPGLIFKFQIVPTPEGRMDRFSKLELMMRKEDEVVTINDTQHPYLQEIIPLFRDVPRWDVLYLYDKLQPLPAYYISIKNPDYIVKKPMP